METMFKGAGIRDVARFIDSMPTTIEDIVIIPGLGVKVYASDVRFLKHDGSLVGHPPVFSKENDRWEIWGVPVDECYFDKVTAVTDLVKTVDYAEWLESVSDTNEEDY